MNVTRVIHYILFLVGFIYLIMCPAANDLDDNFRHDVIRKVGVRKTQSNPKKDIDSKHLQLSYNPQTTSLLFLRTTQELPILLSSQSTLNPSILASVRLLL